ncbi:hypothetical protein [Haloarcula sp. JP-L23]|uniref:hypothetical protein n=1 Tax=Haloarcula sp. JP-L23 TaxID=2716717 RepID=UPI00140F3C43|nr:hypothetical protein G9465_23680 [Haloarcula sp. JP-L23]
MTTYHELTGFQRDYVDGRTNTYTLTDAGQHQLQQQAETLTSLCDCPRPVADGSGHR